MTNLKDLTPEEMAHEWSLGGRGDAWQYQQRAVAQIERLRNELEQLRVQLAGCSVAALSNTDASVSQRARPGDYGWSPAYQDVCAAVDREIALRDKTCEWVRDEPIRDNGELWSWVRGCDGKLQLWKHGPYCHMCGGRVVTR